MTKAKRKSTYALFAAALLVACGDELPTQALPGDPDLAVAGGAADAELPVYGLGPLVRHDPRDRCSEDAHRQFDFWLGEWEVFSPAGEQLGTNSVRSELDGCVVSESWTDAQGGRGRSINAFDAETGQWHQTWVSAFHSGHLRMAGGVDADGRMDLSGERQAVLLGVTLFDRYTWRPLDGDRVEQVGTLDVPAAGFHGEFIGIYERRDVITPAPESETTGCQPGGASEASRQLDFWLGDWTVAANGKQLGRSSVTTDLSGCLIEERFETPEGYRAVSFASFDWWERQWFRTYIDNRGERVELSGGLTDGVMLLAGSEARTGAGELPVRVRIEPVDAETVRQVWQTSPQGDKRWRTAIELIYTR